MTKINMPVRDVDLMVDHSIMNNPIDKDKCNQGRSLVSSFDADILSNTNFESCHSAMEPTSENIDLDDIFCEYSSSDSESPVPMDCYYKQPIGIPDFHRDSNIVNIRDTSNNNNNISSYYNTQTFLPGTSTGASQSVTGQHSPPFTSWTNSQVVSNSGPQLGLTKSLSSVPGNGESLDMLMDYSKHSGFIENKVCSRTETKSQGTGQTHLPLTEVHPRKWGSKDVLDWLFYNVEQHHVDCSMLRAENFRSLTGADLCRMGPEDFRRLDATYGKLIYDLFHSELNRSNFRENFDLEDGTTDDMGASPTNMSPPTHAAVQRSSNTCHINKIYDNFPDLQLCPEPSGFEYQGHFFDSQRQYPSYPCQAQGQGQHLAAGPYPEHFHTSQISNYGMMVNPSQFAPFGPQSHMGQGFPPFSGDFMPTEIPRRRPGRPRIKSLPTEEEVADKKVKNQHLWEFIYEILMNPSFNPQFLRWENQREGVFRFVQSEAVAQLWGRLKNNENMTYEKLSRAMRHYYKRGILERVEGRRLVYKFTNVAMEKAREKRYSV